MGKMKYVALLRGINVGGKNIIKMVELRAALEQQGLEDVATYIQSGNIIFSSGERDKLLLEKKVEETILKEFGLTVPTVVLSQDELKTIVDELPKGWATKDGWRYYYYFLKSPYNIDEILVSIGDLKPDIETLDAGKGVLYQSTDMSNYGRTTTSKIMSKPVYKIATIRNHNTVMKLLGLMNS